MNRARLCLSAETSESAECAAESAAEATARARPPCLSAGGATDDLIEKLFGIEHGMCPLEVVKSPS